MNLQLLKWFSILLVLFAILSLGACGALVDRPPTPTLYLPPTRPGATPAPTVAPPASAQAPSPTEDEPTATPTASPSPLTKPTAGATPLAPSASGLPAFSHVFIIVMENKDYGSVVGSSAAPYINSLTDDYGLATNYTAVAHPSEPNYLALFSGSTWGVADDGVHNINGQNIAGQIEAAGKTWRVFEENVPGGCYTGVAAGNGLYARKHNPAISFTDISKSPTRCANITALTQFDPAAADYELIVPNQCNDMHNCDVATGDGFLRGFVPEILTSSAWKEGGVLFIVWDEGTTGAGGGGRVPLLVISNMVAKGTRSDVAHDHYSLMRTIEDSWGMGCLNNACTANNLGEFFR